MQPAFPTIAIVGSGAVGTYYGGKLALGGAEVRFVMRGDLDAVRHRGSIIIREKDKTAELRPARVFGRTDEIGPVDLVVVGLKATANEALATLVPPLLGPTTAILTLQNGLGSDEEIAAAFGAQRVLGGLAFMASNRTGPGEVTCFHPGSLAIGEFGRRPGARTHALVDQFTRAGVVVELVENLMEGRWRKLVWNVPFNGLGVAHDVATDRICSDPELAGEARALMREVQRAAAAFGYWIPDEFLREKFDVTPGMGPYQPSSLVDYRAGRDVEVEAIWGEPLRRAQAAGVAVPRLAALYEKMKARVAGVR